MSLNTWILTIDQCAFIYYLWKFWKMRWNSLIRKNVLDVLYIFEYWRSHWEINKHTCHGFLSYFRLLLRTCREESLELVYSNSLFRKGQLLKVRALRWSVKSKSPIVMVGKLRNLDCFIRVHIPWQWMWNELWFLLEQKIEAILDNWRFLCYQLQQGCMIGYFDSTVHRFLLVCFK